MTFLLLLPALLLGGAWLGAALLLPPWLAVAHRWPALSRSAPLWAALPWLAGLALLLAALFPGDPHLYPALACHCELSMPSWIHLCPVHPERARALLLPAVLVLVLLLPARLGAVWHLLSLPRGQGHAATAPLVLTDLPHRTAVLIGWWRPSLVVDRALWSALGERERAALLAHEAGHLARRDPLMLMLLQALLCGAPRALAWRVVRCWLDRAEEQADSAAAHSLGDPLVVAAALLRCARLGSPAPSGGLAWTGGGRLERRITRLLAPAAPTGPARPDIGLLDALLLGALVLPVMYLAPWLHHLTEHLLNLSL